MIIKGDCIEEMKNLNENSVDAIITDPPYGLEFMGKDWDKFKEGKNIAGGNTGKDTPYARSKPTPSFYQLSKKRFGKKGEEGENDLKVKKNFKVLPRFFQSDLITFQKFTEEWAIECLRVLKPGGFLLSFGGTRTYHRMTCGIEDAGFEIRDCIMWLYGSGFPKSLNIGKQIDKIQGNEREVVGKERCGKNAMMGGLSNQITSTGEVQVTKGSSEWEGWGTALKPACEPIVVARKPLSEKNVASNVLKWGTGGINIDGCRINYEEEKVKNLFGKISKIPELTDKQKLRKYIGNNEGNESVTNNFGVKDIKCMNPESTVQGRFPSNIILDEEAGKMLDEQSGICKTGNIKGNKVGFKKGCLYGDSNLIEKHYKTDKPTGASRFFYCAKASKSERNAGCEGLEEKIATQRMNASKLRYEKGRKPTPRAEQSKMVNSHPTVKPIKLMEYLIKLVSKEGATVLDPFLGSGTTAIACLKLNRQFIGIEKEEEYIKIAKARINHYNKQRKLK